MSDIEVPSELPCPWCPGESHVALDLCTPGVVLPLDRKRQARFTCASKCAEPDPDGLPRGICTGGAHSDVIGNVVCTCACHRESLEPATTACLSEELDAALAQARAEVAARIVGAARVGEVAAGQTDASNAYVVLHAVEAAADSIAPGWREVGP